MINTHPLVITPEVQAALTANHPIVALESTLITHGLPYPINLQTAQAAEQIIRAEGAIPATIAVIQGQIKIGLTPNELEYLSAPSPAQPLLKLSSRDLGIAIAQKKSGGTTVAGTLRCAQLANIKIFATGGIGGAHRDAEKTWDISADLSALQNTPIAVISSGAKSILDLGLTLEILETLGVPVIGYRTQQFPTFYSRSSPFPLEHHTDDLNQIALMLNAHWALESSGGILIANPIPVEKALPAEWIEEQIQLSLAQAAQQSIHGKALTPFLLAQLTQQTQGRTLESNIALILNNAKIGAQLAQAYRLVTKST